MEFVAGLQHRLDAAGFDGIAGTLERARLLRELLDGISPRQLEAARAAVASLEACLARLGRDLDRLRELQARLSG